MRIEARLFVWLLTLLSSLVSVPQSAAAPIGTAPTILEVEIDYGPGTDFANLFELRIDATFSGFDAGETMRVQSATVVGGIHLSHELRRLTGGLFVPADPLPGPLTTQRFAIINSSDLNDIEASGQTLFFFFTASVPGTAELVSLTFSGAAFGGSAVTVEATTSLDPVLVPEPATLWLLSAGAVALFACARRWRGLRMR